MAKINYTFLDDVDATEDVETTQFIKFFSEHKSWLHSATVSEYKNQATNKPFHIFSQEMCSLVFVTVFYHYFLGDCHYKDQPQWGDF